MKLMMPLFSRPLEFSELQIPVIIIENQRHFFDLVSDIHAQIEGEDGDFVLSNCGEPLDLKKFADLIIDVFSLDCNQRKNISLLHKKLAEDSLFDKKYLELKELQHTINLFFQQITDQFPYPLCYSDELSIQDLIKAADFKFNFDDQTFSEALINYCSVMREFGGKEVFFICNLKSWISTDELQNFYKDIFYRKINVVLLENDQREQPLDCEIYRIIDIDLCEIT